VIEQVARQREAVARSDDSVHTIFPVAASPKECEALRDRVTGERAIRTIEVGLGYGVSALHVCEGLLMNANAEALHVVIDPHQATRFADLALQFLEDAGVRDMVEHHADESQVVLPRLLGDDRQFDLAFVDGNHRFDGVFLDFVYLGRLLRPGGILFADDYQLPSVAKAVSFCVKNLEWTVEEVSTVDERHHWAVLRTGRGTDHRSFDHFVEF
jgi:predicted O-methyltransferase YrrM